MSSYATTAEYAADLRTMVESGDIGQFVSPESVLTQPGSTATQVRAGTSATVTQNIQGLTGETVADFVNTIFADQQSERSQFVSLAESALGSLATTASQAQQAATESLLATQTPDYGRWLPFVVLGAVAFLFVVRR